MWNEIVNKNDLSCFMSRMSFFHDSCIKELQYISGAYVDEDLSMYPVNDKRILNVIIQRQFDDVPMIEMQFVGLKSLKLFPDDETYTCEILDSTMILNDEGVFWCDCGNVSENDLGNYEGTLIHASKVRWRSIENRMGQDDFYMATK